MKHKSTVSVEHMLLLALIVIMVVGIIAVIELVFPPWANYQCYISQRQWIDEVESIVEDVKNTGRIQIYKFRVEQLCTECLWYFCTDCDDSNKIKHYLAIKWKKAVEPENASVSVVWNGIERDTDLPAPNTCPADPVLASGKACVLEVKWYEVFVQPC